MAILRFLLGVLAGLVVAVLAVSGMQWIGHRLYPPPEAITPENLQAIKTYLETAPMMALAFVPASWAMGAFLGAIAATLVQGRTSLWPGIIIGAFIVAAGAYTLTLIPHPLWMMVAGLSLPLPLGALGAWLTRR